MALASSTSFGACFGFLGVLALDLRSLVRFGNPFGKPCQASIGDLLVSFEGPRGRPRLLVRDIEGVAFRILKQDCKFSILGAWSWACLHAPLLEVLLSPIDIPHIHSFAENWAALRNTGGFGRCIRRGVRNIGTCKPD